MGFWEYVEKKGRGSGMNLLETNQGERIKELESLLKEISSRTAVKSIMIDDGEESQKMAVLIEDIQDLLNKADQV